MTRIVGMCVVGPGEADRYLRETLLEFKRLCDTAVICKNNTDTKTDALIDSFKFHSYRDNRTWGLEQPSIKEQLLSFVADYTPDWILALDADETMPTVTRETLEKQLSHPPRSWYVYVVNLWNGPSTYRPDMSFWNVRLFAFPKDVGNRHWEHKPLHCGLAPKSAYLAGSYAPIPLLHWGLMKEEDRKKKTARYEKYDPSQRFTTSDYYSKLKGVDEGVYFDVWGFKKDLEAEVASYKNNLKAKTIMFTGPRDFVWVRRSDGSVIDLPKKHVESTLKAHSDWQIVAETPTTESEDSEGTTPAGLPPIISDPLACKLCSFVGKTEHGLNIHKGRNHK